MYYRSFPISGTITAYTDNVQLFIPKASLYDNNESLFTSYRGSSYDQNINKQYNYIYERKFREEVEKFLYNAKPKLYKSTQYGNIFIKIMEVSLTPKSELDRLIYSFFPTAMRQEKLLQIHQVVMGLQIQVYLILSQVGRKIKQVKLLLLNLMTNPLVIYLKPQDIIRLIAIGQYWTQIPSQLSGLLVTGGSLNFCLEKIKDILYQYTHLNNTISFTSLPLYYLEPNTLITVEDDPAGIYGDYIIQSISLPLDISSTMAINAYKVLQKI